MLREIMTARNLSQKVSEKSMYKNGIYIFLKPNKYYSDVEIDDQFLAENVAIVNKKDNQNVLLDEEVSAVSLNGYPLNANKQYSKFFSVSPYLLSKTNTEQFNNIEKEELINFLNNTFCSDYLKDSAENTFKFYENKKLNKDFSNDVFEKFVKDEQILLDSMKDIAETNIKFVDENFGFMKKLSAYFLEKQSEVKGLNTLRFNIVVADDIEEIEQHMGFYLKIRAYANTKNVIVDGRGYLYTFMSAMYNSKKPYANFNRIEFDTNGNEMIGLDELDIHAQLFKFIKLSCEECGEYTREYTNIFMNDDLITNFSDSGSTAYTFRNVKSSYYLTDVRTINSYNKKGKREFSFSYSFLGFSKEYNKTVLIESYEELFNHIFRSNDGVKNNLQVNRGKKENSKVDNKFYEGDVKLRQETKDIEALFKNVDDFIEDERVVYPILKNISDFIFNNTKYMDSDMYKAKNQYRNMLNFWIPLLQKFDDSVESVEFLEFDKTEDVKDDYEYVVRLIRGLDEIYKVANNKVKDKKSGLEYRSQYVSDIANVLNITQLERLYFNTYHKNIHLMLDKESRYDRILIGSLNERKYKAKNTMLRKYRVHIINEIAFKKWEKNND